MATESCQVFAPHVSSIAAVDASLTMVEKYNDRIGELSRNHAETRAIQGDLVCDYPSSCELSNKEHRDYHLITVGAALHCFPDSEVAVQRLAERLRPGGVLFIQDVFDNGHEDSGEKNPSGFTLDELRSIVGSAGLVDFRFEVLPDEFEIEVRTAEVLKVRYFVARGLKREQ